MRSSHLSLTPSADPGRRPRAGSRFWPWPSAGLLLALALSLGGAGSIPLAQAARAGDYTSFVIMAVRKAGPADRTVCVGDRVDVRASVALRSMNDGVIQPAFTRLMGWSLAASVADPGIGAISPAANETRLDTDPIGQARFTFTAQKAGTTTVKVDGKVVTSRLLGVALSSDTVTGEMPVTVKTCEYRVSVIAIWTMEGPITLIAKITDAGLPLLPGFDDKYLGKADVTWSGVTQYPPPCHVIHDPVPSRASIVAEKLGDLLEVTVRFEATAAMLSTLVCPTASQAMFANQFLTPDVLHSSVPDYGGTFKQEPALGPKTLSQVADVSVVPVSEQ
jgi:hypothetical protein